MGVLAGLSFKVKDAKFDPDEFGAVMDEAYLTKRRVPSDKAKVSFAPSGIGYGAGGCARKWYYALEGGHTPEEDAGPLDIDNMEYGIEAHERIQGLLEAAGILKDKEMRLEMEDPPVFGFGDAIIDWHGNDVMVEIKTTKEQPFVKRSMEMKAPGYQLIQLLLYMKITNIPRGLFIVENKNTGQLLFIPVSWTEENVALLENTLEWLRTVYAAHLAKTLPVRPFTKGSAACKGCPFTTLCWDDEAGTEEIPPLELPS